MLLDWIWGVGQVLCFVGLLFGAYLVLTESEAALILQGKTSSVPVLLSPNEFLMISRLGIEDNCCVTCGNSAIDTEHRELRKRLCAVQAAILRGGSLEEISVIFEDLIRAMRQHFSDEEATLAGANYPGLAIHACLHQRIIEHVGSLPRKFRAGRLAIADGLQYLFRDVYVAHTLEADRQYTPYLQNAH